MTIKELNNLKESMNKMKEFNKVVLEYEYERRNEYESEQIAIEEYKNAINMSIKRLTLQCKELSGIDMSEFYNVVELNNRDLFTIVKLNYSTAISLLDNYYIHIFKVFMLIMNTL